MKTTFPILLILLLSACSGSNHLLPMYEEQKQIAAYIDSPSYLNDFTAVTDKALSFLEGSVDSNSDNSKLAIVLDIDETSLSNWQAYKLNGFARITEGGCDLAKGPCGIRAWQAMATSPALQPTLNLAKKAHELGIKVVYISGRPAELYDATFRNLSNEGFPIDKLIIFPPGVGKYQSASDFKAPARAELEENGLKILLCLGDQESDLNGGHCEKTFKLPNPVYFLP